MNDRATRVGVVGAGYWGPNLIRQCANLGVLDSVCDIDTNALAALKGLYPNIATVSQFESLLKRPIDAVIIAAPAQFHAPMCLQAITAGKHVFVEKPLALSVADGEQIAEAAESAGVQVFVGHVLLYHPAVRKIRSLITEGVIGDVLHVRSRRLSLGKLRAHESVWWSFAPHDVALMIAIMKSEPVSCVAAQDSLRGGDISDVAYADYRFPGERSAHLEVCWLDPEKSARLDVFGSKGVLTLADSRSRSTLVLKPFSVKSDERNLPVAVRAEEQQIAFADDEPLKLEVEAFINTVRTGAATESSARQGIAVLKALSMADEASQSWRKSGVLV